MSDQRTALVALAALTLSCNPMDGDPSILRTPTHAPPVEEGPSSAVPFPPIDYESPSILIDPALSIAYGESLSFAKVPQTEEVYLFSGSRFDNGVLISKRNTNGEWRIHQMLSSPSSSAFEFGRTIETSGNWLFVGTSSEKIFTYQRVGDQWILQGELQSDFPNGNTGFSDSIAASTNRLLVGAPQEEVSGACEFNGQRKGVVYTYRRVGSAWTRTTKITIPETTTNTFQCDTGFGEYIAASGNYFAISARRVGSSGNSFSGRVYVFEDANGSIFYTQELAPVRSNLANNFFGSELTMSEDLLITSTETYIETFSRNLTTGIYEFAGTLRVEPIVVSQYRWKLGLNGNHLSVGQTNDVIGIEVGRVQSYTWDNIERVWSYSMTLNATNEEDHERYGKRVERGPSGHLAVGLPSRGKIYAY